MPHLIPMQELLQIQRNQAFVLAWREFWHSTGDARAYWRMRLKLELQHERAAIEARTRRLMDAAQPQRKAA